MAITAAEAHASFKDFKKSEEREINEGKSAVISDTLGIDIDGFQFEVTSRINPAQIRLVATVNPDDTYSVIIESYAKFMAAVATHPDMKNTEFWVHFDNETGCLPDVVSFIIDNTERSSPVIKKFR